MCQEKQETTFPRKMYTAKETEAYGLGQAGSNISRRRSRLTDLEENRDYLLRELSNVNDQIFFLKQHERFSDELDQFERIRDRR